MLIVIDCSLVLLHSLQVRPSHKFVMSEIILTLPVDPLKRFHNSCVSEGAYMGQTDYLSGIDWKNRSPFRLLQHKMRAYDNCSCVVVGRVTPLQAYLEPHGDFDALSNAPETFGNARLMFSLVRPDVTVPYFPEEFNTAVSNIRCITHGLPASNCVVDDTFLTRCDDGNTMINFSWDLFEDVSHHLLATPNVVLNVHPFSDSQNR